MSLGYLCKVITIQHYYQRIHCPENYSILAITVPPPLPPPFFFLSFFLPAFLPPSLPPPSLPTPSLPLPLSLSLLPLPPPSLPTPSLPPPQDLVSLKSLENYRLVECEDQHGSNVTALGDDFTVATALEDLEFGFNVVTNTQKVRSVSTRSKLFQLLTSVQIFNVMVLESKCTVLYEIIIAMLSDAQLICIHVQRSHNPFDLSWMTAWSIIRYFNILYS